MNLCEKALSPGSPMTIKAMDCLINHWAKHKNKNDAINTMTQRKWKALMDGYGVGTTIAIMKMTDPKRKNSAMWKTEPSKDNNDDGAGVSGSSWSISETEHVASFSDDEGGLEFWGEDEKQKGTKKKVH